jgi:DNA-binding PadR family transcriptional regulator
MSVRQSLLAILDQSPCYGYQLRGEFDARTGGTWPLNAGQVYSTLDRLERDGLVASDGADGEGRVRYSITAEGSAEVRGWLRSPVQRQSARDELAMKLAVAATLPGVDIADVIQVQRSATIATLQDLTRTKASHAAPTTAADLAWSLVVESMIFAAEAEVRWLDHSEATIAKAARAGITAVALSEDRPKRGRPARAEAVTEEGSR